MTQDFFKGLLADISSGEPQQRTIKVMTGSKGSALINKTLRQSPIREHLKAATDLGVVTATRRGQLFGMLDSDDEEIQKLAEGIILGLKI